MARTTALLLCCPVIIYLLIVTRERSSARASACALFSRHLAPVSGLRPLDTGAAATWDGGGISHMNIPPSDPTLTIIFRSGEMRTAATFPLCPDPMLVVKPSS